MKMNQLTQFEGKSVTVIVQGLQKPCGGTLLAHDSDSILIKPNTGKDNVILIPMNKVVSIMQVV
jgi:hypothetical protein